LVLTLESNPTTGYRWEVVEAKDAVLRQRGEAEFTVASELDPPPPGTGGVEVFRFEAVEAGETLLELVYHRPWEEGVEPLETYSVQVEVR
jgi:inhibitor of cysteine peptidase